MKNVILSALFAILIVACVANEAKNNKQDSCCNNKDKSACCSKSTDTKAVAVSVDDLLASPQKYIDKKIDLSGLVVHTCKHSGKKMFLKGSNDSVYVKVEAGDKISKFEPGLEGSNVIATGVLSVITLDDHEDGESCATEEKGKSYFLTCEEFKTL